ncbi:uncharacterized protein [Asterias amurensis]|uniref:uncharacterized protein n=1 Tax=Asterias amurensis TaxID=7602 RepID=UPI003AB77790
MAKSMLLIVSMLVVLAFITPGCESQELEDAYSDCESTEFQCADGQCIPDEGLCDGEPQCEDHTDEYKCQTMEELAIMYETIFDGDIMGLDLNDTGIGNGTFEEATQTPGSEDQVAKSRAKRSTYFYVRGRGGYYYRYPRVYLRYIIFKWCKKHKAIKPDVTTTTTTTLDPTDKPIPSTTTQEPTEAIPSTSISATSTNDPTNAIPSITSTNDPTNAIPSVTSTQDPTAPP